MVDPEGRGAQVSRNGKRACPLCRRFRRRGDQLDLLPSPSGQNVRALGAIGAGRLPVRNQDPREITHERRLRAVDRPFGTFVEEVSALGGKLGPLLCQLPPSLRFDAADAGDAFAAMRKAFTGLLVIEPRHRSWATPAADALLARYGIDRVLADPAPVSPADDFPEPVRYIRLHGAPTMYHSSYSDAEIRSFGGRLAADGWCVFDNTASGAAIENALTMRDRPA